MPLNHPIRDLTLATLLTLGCGCVIVPGAPTPARTPHPATAHAPKQQHAARPKQVAHAGKPAKPGPAQHPVDETGGGKPVKPGTRPGGGRPETRPGPGPDVPPTEPEVPPSPPSPDATHMVVPVRVDFAEAVARIDEKIVRTAKQDWQTVSAPGDLTRVEVRYKVWRAPIAATFDDRTLKVGVTVRYAADVRVSTKNPFGGRIWITRGESWGTRSEPQQIAAKFHATFDIKDDFSVKAGVELDDIDHGQAPSGEVCVQAGVKLCVSKAVIAPMVRKNLERYLVPRIEKALNAADEQLERSMNLKKHAQKLWGALQQPRLLPKLWQAGCPKDAGAACTSPPWLVAQPTALGVSQPRKDGKDLRVDLAVAGRLAVQLGDKPRMKPTALPKLKPVTDPPGFVVRAQLRVPMASLADELGQHLKGKQLGGRGAPEIEVAHVTLVEAPDARPSRRLHLVVTIRGALAAELQLWGELTWDAKRRELSVANFDYTVDTASQALKQLSAANHAALLALVAEQARWKLDTQAAALGKGITQALGGMWQGHLSVDGALDRVQVEDVLVKDDMLAAGLVLAGQLEVGFTP